MKQITPVQDTSDETLIATQLRVLGVSDDYETQATFNWYLFTETGELVNNGTLICAEEDYLLWDGSNEFPYTFVAGVKNLEII
jgi:hypothetical protein